jgi:hypothetical protein
MSSGKHTPGPWIVEAEHEDGEALISSARQEAWSAFARVVVRMADCQHDRPEGLANARLIAAAPDLLKVLRTAEAELVTLIPRLAHPARKNIEALKSRVSAAIKAVDSPAPLAQDSKGDNGMKATSNDA